MYKILLIVLFLGMPFFGACAVWMGRTRHPDHHTDAWWAWTLPAVLWIVVAVPGIWAAGRLKRVRVDDGTLYVSKHRCEISIPLTQVSEVTDGRFLSYLMPAAVTIHLRHPSPVGTEIVFIPRFRLYWSGLHPVARELKELVERAKEAEKADRPLSAQTVSNHKT